MSILVSMFSFVIAMLVPLWVPLVVMVLSLLCPIVYDFDAPKPSRRYAPYLTALLYHILLCGIIQPIIVSIVVLIVYPVAATIVVIAALCRYCIRSVWDWVIFKTVIRKRGRIPAANSFLVKRITGPGLQDNFFYQISPEQAIAAIECHLEDILLRANQKILEKKMAEPLDIYDNFIRKVFNPFSAGVAVNDGNYEKVSREVKDLHRALQDKVNQRRNDLQLHLQTDVRERLKLTTHDLKATLRLVIVMLEKFYPETYFPLVINPERTLQKQPLSSRQISSEQQSRIDSGISTTEEVEDRDLFEKGSGSSLCQSRALLNPSIPPSVVSATRSLTGRNKLVHQNGFCSAKRSSILTRSYNSENISPEDQNMGGKRRYNQLEKWEHGSSEPSRLKGHAMGASQDENGVALVEDSSTEGLYNGDGKKSALSVRITPHRPTVSKTINRRQESIYVSEEEFWISKGLGLGDYATLAAIMLTDVFSPDILTSIDDEDTVFKIGTSGVDLNRYTEMLCKCPPRPDLDSSLIVYAPRTNSIRVPSPYLDVSSFFPASGRSFSFTKHPSKTSFSKTAMWGASISQRLSLLKSRKVVKPQEECSTIPGLPFQNRMMVPPPIPHPAVIAVIIYNREANDPIVLSSVETQTVLRVIDESVSRNDCPVSSRMYSFEEDSCTSNHASSPPSLYEGAVCMPDDLHVEEHNPAEEQPSTSYAANSSPERRLGTDTYKVVDANPLRALLESHPPFSVPLDLAPPEVPPENDYEDSLRIRHALSTDSLSVV